MNYKEYNDNEILSYISEKNEEAIELIYEKYKPLINKIASNLYQKYCKNTGLDINDLIQEGMIGLNNAMNHYQENRDVLFYTYAKKCIERRMISTIIMANRKKHKVLNDSISFEVNLRDSNTSIDAFIKDNSNNPENILINMEKRKELINVIENDLSTFEQQILQLRLDGFEYKQIAEIINKDVKAVDNAVQRIRMKIKNILLDINN